MHCRPLRPPLQAAAARSHVVRISLVRTCSHCLHALHARMLTTHPPALPAASLLAMPATQLLAMPAACCTTATPRPGARPTVRSALAYLHAACRALPLAQHPHRILPGVQPPPCVPVPALPPRRQSSAPHGAIGIACATQAPRELGPPTPPVSPTGLPPPPPGTLSRRRMPRTARMVAAVGMSLGHTLTWPHAHLLASGGGVSGGQTHAA